MQHHDPNLGAKIAAEGMRVNARSQMRGRHGKRASTKSKLLGILILLAPFIAILWWVYS